MHTPIFENSAIYTCVEGIRAAAMPLRSAAIMGKYLATAPGNPIAHTELGAHISASMVMLERLTRVYPKPEFGITSTIIDGKKVPIHQHTVLHKPFCNLVHFAKDKKYQQPKMLVVAPMSGHYATLLRGTVVGLLPHFDVYITDWMSANTVPLSSGPFDLDDYIDYVQEYISLLDSDVHVMAVCQPTVPVLAAISLMSARKNQRPPHSMILIGGPVDARQSPTEVNDFAKTRSMNWFETNMITRVPMNYPGAMRAVFPGFIQLAGFMAMNLQRHIGEHMKLFQHLVEGDGESVENTRKFYNEYLAVSDLPAEFYLQTVEVVFKNFDLPLGRMVSRGRPINPGAIKKTALLVLEGEKDDISGIGQTKAAMHLCKNLPANMKHYHLQKDVGHYGIFNGRRYRECVVPIIVEFTKKHQKW